MSAAIPVSDEKLGDAAMQLAGVAEALATSAPLTGARLKDTQQRTVLSAARDLAFASSALVRSARQQQRAPGDTGAKSDGARSEKQVQDAVKALIDALASTESQLGQSLASIEAARKSILAMVGNSQVRPPAPPSSSHP